MKQTKRTPVSTLTHSRAYVVKHFLAWREALKDRSMIGHNGGPRL